MPAVLTCYKRMRSHVACAIVLLLVLALFLAPRDAAELLVVPAAIALMMLIFDYALQGVYTYIAVLTDRWYERRPSAYCRTYKPPRMVRLAGALLALNVALTLFYAAGTPSLPFLRIG